MKFNEKNRIKIIDGSFDVVDIVREKSFSGDIGEEESLHICNLSDIIQKHFIWKQSFPRIFPFYAVKCNPDPVIIETLAALGTGFDCAAKSEIANVVKFNVAPEQIIFANPTKPISHLQFAAKHNVTMMTVDNGYEMRKISKHYPNAKLILRIRCDAKAALYALGKKYGCDPVTEAPELIALSKAIGLNLIGISFHVGSGCMDSPVYGIAIKKARELFDYAESVGYKFNLLDIGGGFPGNCGSEFNEIVSIVNSSLDSYFPSSDITIIAEPGRYYVESASNVVGRVHSLNEIRQNGKLNSMVYYINDGVFGSFLNNFFESTVHRPLTLKLSDAEVFTSTVWGPTCDCNDKVCDNVPLPRLNIDDFIIFENMGAYSITLATTFNGHPLPIVEYYIERKHLQDISATTALLNKNPSFNLNV